MTFTDEVVARHNRGVALMGHFDYSSAFTVFEKLAADFPNWKDVQVDLAIATLNRREPGDSERALQLLKNVTVADPTNLRAIYCQGILALDSGDPESALKTFSQVVKADPKDAYALYYMGQCMSQLSDIDGALQQFLKVIELDPYFRSAYYGVFQGLLRKGNMQEANKYREDFERLADNPQARLAEIKYTRMGPKATVSPISRKPLNQQAVVGPVFTDAATRIAQPPAGFAWNTDDAQRSITYCDIDMDGDMDLFVANGLYHNEGTRNAVLVAHEGVFSIATDHPLAETTNINSALWGDYDNDGYTDVYFCRNGINQLWRQTRSPNGGIVWRDVTDATSTGSGSINTHDGAFVDADHDGDLDIFLANSGPNELLSNNLDGTFRQLADDYGIAGADVTSTTVMFGDFDNDRDADILVINDSAQHEVLINDRLWSYSKSTTFNDLLNAEFSVALAADADADGQLEIYTASESDIRCWEPDDNGRWKFQVITSEVESVNRIEAIDVQGDGKIELVTFGSKGQQVVTLSRLNAGNIIESTSVLRNGICAPLSKDGPVIIGFDDNTFVRRAAGPGRHPFTELSFSGKENRGEQMRSNRSGIGVDVAVRRGTDWTAFNTFRSNSGPGQSLGPIQVGLGVGGSIDFVQMTWPDGVFQTEIDVAQSGPQFIEETQRQVASCPVVFAWNGKQYEFVTDVLGVGGIGFNLGKGNYAKPRPWENLLLTPDQLQAKNGNFEIRIGEPMEEVCYLDSARLVAYDLPTGWEIALDERMGINNPQPTGRPLFYRRELIPVGAVNDRGRDVLPKILAADLVAAEPGERDARFLGLTKKHSIVLTFDQPISQCKAPILLFDGWIEYPYSQTMFSAWQANSTFDAPTLEALALDGSWRIVAENFGYMAGMPRRSAFPIPLDRLPSGARRLRLTSNIELYWDKISVVDSEPCPKVKKTELPLTAAIVAEAGYPRRTTFEQRRPHYDYLHRIPMWDCRHLTGFYTSFGDARSLIQSIDDACAVFGPGEEIQLTFSARPPLGATRRFVLELNGWAKDNDLYTRDGETVNPMPARNASEIPIGRDVLHQRYNRRFRTGVQ